MMKCPDADAIVAIGDALEWNVADGLRHLQTCDECRDQIELLQLTHSAFAATEALDADVAQRVTDALHAAARHEAVREQHRRRWLAILEPMAGGVTGLLLLRSGGIQIGSIWAAVIAFTLGAVAIIGGRALARRVPACGIAEAAS